MPPDGFRASMQLAMLLVEYEDGQVVVSPPHRVFRMPAKLGHLQGFDLPK